MSAHKSEIEKICKFAFSFSNMNTVFIDTLTHITLEYGYDKVPEILKVYLGSVSTIPNIHDTDSEQDVFFYSNCLKTNFTVARVYCGGDSLGSIVIGPYLLEEPTTLMIEDVIFKNNLSISLRHIIKQY